DGSAVVPRAAPGDSAVALRADDSSPRAAPDDSAVVLPEAPDDSAVVVPEAPDDLAFAPPADGSAVVVPEAPDDLAFAPPADGSAVVLPEDDSSERAAESAVPGGQHWARWQDGRWSASPLGREAPA